MADLPVHFEARVHGGTERTCWGCGLRLVLPSSSPVFKCGWCGAITNQNMRNNYKDKYYRWRRVRDRFFVCVVSLFMLFVICGGVWAVYPVIFSTSFQCSVLHSFITCVLSVSTVTTFSMAAFRSAGPPPIFLWGSYPVVGKGDLEDYTFCHACSKPKSPQTHHCRSCGTCVLDMDHHCPFIGNCVGAGNHRHFIGFLISTIISTTYVAMICTYCVSREWPDNMQVSLYTNSSRSKRQVVAKIIKEVALGVMSCLVRLSTRGIILVYLIVISVSVQIGLWMLLWQQLCYIYEGHTYLSHLSAQSNNSNNNNGVGQKDCQNLVHFFGFPPRYLCWRSRKRHWK